jgi:leader peptidase (prepilin peptidase)/N-methyltransferase
MTATWNFLVASAYLPWFWGVIGLLIGSFLNVVILRLPKRLEWGWGMECHVFQGGSEKEYRSKNPAPADLVFAKSQCPHCGHSIKPWENVPVLGYLWLRGKCAKCKAPISAQYPIIEALTGALFFAVAFFVREPAMAIAMMAFMSMMVAISGIDAKTKIIPDVIVFPLLWLGLIVSAAGVDGAIGPSQAIVGAVVGYLILWGVYWGFKLITKKEGMGYGDFKLLAAIGAWLGWINLPWVLLISTVVGVIFGIYSIIQQGQDRRVGIPFGPFLAVAAILVWLGNQANILPSLLP